MRLKLMQRCHELCTAVVPCPTVQDWILVKLFIVKLFIVQLFIVRIGNVEKLSFSRTARPLVMCS